ncbi:MAG: sulfite exporter TauE/SafE family protein [Methanomassiliicoccaceae archaeon]|nr:sulfite exporter TauE/SafE family protein [Methanomassiliicoccaceae archaeon]
MEPIMIVGLVLLSLAAGIIGSVFGLGGGIIVVPVLTILYDMPTHDAVAISLVAIVAISASGASSLVKNRSTNVRLGLVMEIAAAAGAVIGAVIALYLQSWVLTLSFAFVMVYSALYMFARPERVTSDGRDGTFAYQDPKAGEVRYEVKNIRTGMLGFFAAGITSPLSGVGGGAIKVPIMNVHMNIPMKVATATSSFVIGITAFAGAAVYLLGGVIEMQTAAIVIVGAFCGSRIGIRILPKIDPASLRRYFSVLLIFLAAIMFLRAGGVI